MAAKYSTAATKAQTVPLTRFENSEYKGNFHVAYDEFDLAAVLAITDTVEFMHLPPGARVIQVAMSYPDLGTAGTGTLGWMANGVDIADPDGFFTALDFKTAADTVLMSSEANVPGFGVKFTVETKVLLTMTEATTASSGKIKVAVSYVME
jgi:hypothetical protein